jgi:xylulokinase
VLNDVLMSVDIGTTNCKTALFDVEGRQLAISRTEHTTERRQPGPDDWWNATLYTMGEALQASGVDPKSVVGLGFSGRGGSLLAFLDESDRVLHPQVVAEEVAVIAERLRSELFPEHLYELIGSIGIVPWVLWMQENNRETLNRITKIMGGKDYVVYKLTGQFVSDYLDKYHHRKPVTFCEANGIIEPIQHKLPPLVPATDVAGTILPELAAKFDLKRDLPVVVGGRDGTCAVTGVGVTEKGQACSTIASSVCIRVISDKILLDDPENRVECRMHTVPGLWILDSTPGGGTTSYRWFRNEFGHIEVEAARFTDGDAYALMNEEAAHTEPGADGLIFLPYVRGMSAPFRNRHARGVLFGLKLSHTRGHVIRAIKEGIIYANRSGLRILEGLGAKTKEIRTTGGGTRSPLWNQIQADIMGLPVVTSSVEEPECLGAAVILAVGLGIYKTAPEAISSMVRVEKRYEPRMGLKDVYDRNFEIYEGLCHSCCDRFSVS